MNDSRRDVVRDVIYRVTPYPLHVSESLAQTILEALDGHDAGERTPQPNRPVTNLVIPEVESPPALMRLRLRDWWRR